MIAELPAVRVRAFTQGRSVPSSRFRVKALLEGLGTRGIDMHMSEALVSAYPPARRLDRPLWLLRELLHRLPQVIGSYGSDVVILQRELLSTIPTLEFLTKAPRILDVDDAIWLHRRGIAANSIARRVDHIVCGNQYLADYFGQFGRPTTIIPTGVDTLRFSPRRERRENRVIGWSGTSGGYRFLYDIEIPLSESPLVS